MKIKIHVIQIRFQEERGILINLHTLCRDKTYGLVKPALLTGDEGEFRIGFDNNLTFDFQADLKDDEQTRLEKFSELPPTVTKGMLSFPSPPDPLLDIIAFLEKSDRMFVTQEELSLDT